ncbi:MAG TPA: TIGR03435 family protein [Verrucomicrobiae bacterium]|nr:TIGR03435 family protein [Verrucomicrobiae bacterium]
MTNDDLTLLREYARRHSEEAFATLVSRYVNLVYSVALRQVRDPQLAQEITQAAFIILARKADSFGPKTILSGWLCRTARYASLNAQTIQRRRQRREEQAHMQNSLTDGRNASSPSMQEETWVQIAPLLDAAMEKLSRNEHDALVLRFFENRSFKEVGAALGASEDAAKMRVSRALEKLRKFFTKRGVSSTTALLAGAISVNSVEAAPVAVAKAATTVAIAKGSIASASTITLVKGALNLMAWAKVKTTLLGTSVLVAAATTTAVAISWELKSEALDKNPPVVILRPTQFQHMTGGASSGLRFVEENVSLRALLEEAYLQAANFQPLEYRMVLPSDCPTGHFDFMFTQSGSAPEALKNEIKKQFGLVAHVETRQTAVLLLKVTNPNAPGLKIAGGKENQQIGNFRNVVFKGVPINGMRNWLEHIIQTPVIDQTGLTNFYDISVKWMPSPGQSEADAVRQLLPDQFGLELVPTNMPIKMLVVTKTKT